MASSPRSPENLRESDEHMDSIQRSLDNLLSLSEEDGSEAEMLRSRMDEQSGLIFMLNERRDELQVRCQELQKANTELEGRVTGGQRELGIANKKTELLERRFKDLATNNTAITAFMEGHKKENMKLKLENKQLQFENDSLFSLKLENKEMIVQELKEEIKLLTETYTNKENDYKEQISAYESKFQEEESRYKAKEASLLDQLHKAEQQHKAAVEMSEDLKLKLQRAKEELAAKVVEKNKRITSLTTEKDQILSESLERGKVIQDKQKEIKQMEKKWKQEKKARTEAEDRFEHEAEAVNADTKVLSLQFALDELETKHQSLNKDFQAYKEHSTNLLTQERELNKKLRRMIC